MKKLIITVVVLGLAVGLNAGTVDLVVSGLNGQPITPVKEITIVPTDVISFDFVYTSQPGWSVWSMSVDLTVQGPGTLDISTITWPAGYWNPDLSRITVKSYGAMLDVVAKGVGTVPPGIILDHFLFHCDDYGNVIITLKETMGNGPPVTETDGADLFVLLLGDGVIIHQIPEPLTLTLFVVGGLFIARRKR